MPILPIHDGRALSHIERPYGTWALIVANVYFGMDTRLSFGVALRAAEGLMGTGP